MHVWTSTGRRVFYLVDITGAEQFLIGWYLSHLEFFSSWNNTAMNNIVKSFCMSLIIEEVEQIVKDILIFTDFEGTLEATVQMSTLSCIPSCQVWRSISPKLFPSLVNSFVLFCFCFHFFSNLTIYYHFSWSKFHIFDHCFIKYVSVFKAMDFLFRCALPY